MIQNIIDYLWVLLKLNSRGGEEDLMPVTGDQMRQGYFEYNYDNVSAQLIKQTGPAFYKL